MRALFGENVKTKELGPVGGRVRRKIWYVDPPTHSGNCTENLIVKFIIA